MFRYISIFFFLLITGFVTNYWLYTDSMEEEDLSITTENIIGKRHFLVKIKRKTRSFDLLDPETAPPELREQVMCGYHIFTQTQQYASEYVGNKLTCNNCHFAGGNTLGGRNGGISLVGVVATYPRHIERLKKVITLRERINNCFMRSMNGKPLPQNSMEMNALIAYLDWISQEVMRIGNFPWLGLQELKSTHEPNSTNGKIIYDNKCSICHDYNGGGAPGIPPLWGPYSFNDGAGMHTLNTLSRFVYYNMPYQQPALTEEEALDVASFIITRPRPKFKPD